MKVGVEAMVDLAIGRAAGRTLPILRWAHYVHLGLPYCYLPVLLLFAREPAFAAKALFPSVLGSLEMSEH